MASNVTDVFKQTSRTILFEHFSDDEKCFSLDRILNNVDESGNLTAENKKELETLTVYTFGEFLDRFAPTVYEMALPPQKDEDGNMISPPRYIYTLDKKEVNGLYHREMRLDQHLYYEMLMQLYREKCLSTQSDEDFNDDKILEMITPKHEVKKLERLRQQMLDNQVRRYFGEKKGENVNEYINKYDELFESVGELADNPLVMIAQRLDDIAVSTKVPQAADAASQVTGRNVAGYLSFDEKGHLSFKEKVEVKQLAAGPNTEKEGTGYQLLESKATREIRQDIKDEYEDRVPEDMRSEYVLNNMLKALAPLDGEDIDLPALKEERHSLETIYSEARTSFAKALCGTIEKFLGVKAFFDHAADESGYFAPGLLVTNCSAARLMEDDMLDRFTAFIKGRGIKQSDNRIWLGILPAICTSNSNNGNDVDLSKLSRKDRMAAKKQQRKTHSDVLDLDAGKNMLRILDDAHIMTFCNIRDAREKEKGFENVTAAYLRQRKNDFSDAAYSHAVYAYPNFNIMRYRKVPVHKDNAEEMAIQSGDNRIELPNTVIDAAYIAAGLMAGSQQADYLKKHDLDDDAVNPQNVCVHVNLEDDRVRSRLCTHLNLSTKDTWFVEEEARGFGMAFCGSPRNIDGQEMEHIYIDSARTLAKNEKGRYYPIYQTMLRDFIDAYLRRNSINSGENFKKFKQGQLQEWKDDLKKHPNRVNYMLNDDEDIELVDNNIFIHVGKDEDKVIFKVSIKE